MAEKIEEEKEEKVDHPRHYNVHPSGIECIDVVRWMNFNRGNAVKYIWRAGEKKGEDEISELEKAAWYLRDEIERLKELRAIVEEKRDVG